MHAAGLGAGGAAIRQLGFNDQPATALQQGAAALRHQVVQFSPRPRGEQFILGALAQPVRQTRNTAVDFRSARTGRRRPVGLAQAELFALGFTQALDRAVDHHIRAFVVRLSLRQFQLAHGLVQHQKIQFGRAGQVEFFWVNAVGENVDVPVVFAVGV